MLSPRPCPHRQDRDIIHEIKLTLGWGWQAFLVPARKGKAYPVGEGVAWLQKFHLSFAAPSLTSSSYKAGDWQQVLARLAAV